MKLKDASINMDGVRGVILKAMAIVEPIMERYGPFVCTSAHDGKHMDTSLHYVGLAFDIRTWGLKTEEDKQKALGDLKIALGADYQIIEEEDHFHAEVSPAWLHYYGDPRKAA